MHSFCVSEFAETNTHVALNHYYLDNFYPSPVLESSGAGDKSKHEVDETPKLEKDNENIKYYVKR